MPPIELLSEPKQLSGHNSNLGELVLKNRALLKASRNGAKDLSAKLIAYNKNLKSALVEVIDGNVFTTGWHVVIKQEDSKWWLISDNLVWES